MELMTVKVNGVKLDCYYSYNEETKRLMIISIESEKDTQDLMPLLGIEKIIEIRTEILKHINGDKE